MGAHGSKLMSYKGLGENPKSSVGNLKMIIEYKTDYKVKTYYMKIENIHPEPQYYILFDNRVYHIKVKYNKGIYVSKVNIDKSCSPRYLH